jgi:DNA repair exonuclease SbcCD ATPase subunit
MNVVQSILFFILGFLCAGFLALLVAPSIWRRAVALTRRRIEGSIPLTQAEISAEKDQLRAGFAMEARRLEMTIAGLQQKAAGQAVDIGRVREQLTVAQSEGVQKNDAIAALEGRVSALDAEIGERDQKIGQLVANLAEAEKLIDRRAEDMEKLGQLYDEASFLSSNRQIELVARESEIDKLASDMLAMRNQRKEIEAQSQAIVAESRTAREALRVEQKRVADLDKRIERLLSVVADREDKLERREKELARLREKLKGSGSVARSSTEAAKRPLPVLRADAGAPAKSAAAASSSEIDKAVAKVNSDRERLEERLARFGGQNRKSTGGPNAEMPRNGLVNGNRQESAQLREQMADLAAEVVHLTGMRDGPSSPIAKALARDESQPAAGEGRGRAASLADRVRALQKTTPAG